MTLRSVPGAFVALVAAAAPWAFGATDPSWAAAAAGLCLAAAAAALVADAIRPPRETDLAAERLAACLPLVAALGLVPLPFALRAALAPAGTAAAVAAGAAPGWGPLSLAPHATLSAVALAGAYGGAFLLVSRLARSPAGRGLAAAVLAASGTGLAVLGIAQHVTQPGELQPRIYWTFQVYEAGTPFGPYVNRNHFAGAMTVLGAVAAGECLAAWAEGRRAAACVFGTAVVVMAGALAQTTSRGGLLAAFAAATVLVLSAPAGRRFRGLALTAAGAAAIVAFLAWTGTLEDLLGRLVRLNDRWLNRFGVQQDALAAFAGNPVLGTGAGSFEEVYPAFQAVCDERSFTNAHSDWAQVLMETGVAGAALAACAGGALWRRVRAASGRPGPAWWRVAGPAAGVAGIAVHGFVEVNLHVPANALLTACAAGLAWSACPEPGARGAADGG